MEDQIISMDYNNSKVNKRRKDHHLHNQDDDDPYFQAKEGDEAQKMHDTQMYHHYYQGAKYTLKQSRKDMNLAIDDFLRCIKLNKTWNQVVVMDLPEGGNVKYNRVRSFLVNMLVSFTVRKKKKRFIKLKKNFFFSCSVYIWRGCEV